jgi:hypothetical protein
VLLTPKILAAAQDARYLLDRDYPRELVLKVCGDRYELTANERNLIRRGVFGPEEALRRKQRLLSQRALRGAILGIDGHNVLITLEAALIGGDLVLADDGCVRDLAALGRNHRPGGATRQAAELLVARLRDWGAAEALDLSGRALAPKR